MLVATLLVGLGLAVRLLPELDDFGSTLLTFLALLPLVNAVLDFFSFGLTRRLLRRGADRGGLSALGMALADLGGAAVLFVLLGVALVTSVHVLNEIGAGSLFDLGELFASLRREPEAYWWLYVTFFSTLVPTLLHLMLAAFAAILALIPERAADFVRAQLPHIETDEVAKWKAGGTLTFIGFLAAAAVLHFWWGVWLVIVHFHPFAG